jgi:microcystin-dependent protein
MGTGNDSNTWGNNVNVSDFQIFEDAIANVFTSSATSGTVDLSGTPPPAGPSQARYWQLNFTGSLTGNLTVKVPNLTKEWFVNNSGIHNGFSLLMQTPSGSPVIIPFGWQRIWCDGNNNINIWPYGSFQALAFAGPGAISPSYSSFAEQNSGFYRNTTQDWRFSAGGADIFRFTGAGAGAPNLVDILSGNSLAFAGTKFDPTAIVPTGAEMTFAGLAAPAGWYFEDGAAYSRTTDAKLFGFLTLQTFGNTHGNTTIDGLPVDLRGMGLEGAFVEITGASLGTTIVSINSASSMTVSAGISGSNTGIVLRILPWGQGDGSTTFNIPDARGVVLAGRDNMNGTAKGLLTLAQSQGILGTKLNATGGEQGHTGTAAEMPNHLHAVFLNDPGHQHTVGGSGQLGGNPAGSAWNNGTSNTSNNTTGITVRDTSGGGGTANQTATAGSGVAHNNIQPTAIRNIIIKR